MSDHAHDIETTVTFASASAPYHHHYGAGTLASQVLQDALTSFGIVTDGTTRYYLFLAGVEISGTAVLGDLLPEHGHEHELKLALRTETISGRR